MLKKIHRPLNPSPDSKDRQRVIHLVWSCWLPRAIRFAAALGAPHQ